MKGRPVVSPRGLFARRPGDIWPDICGDTGDFPPALSADRQLDDALIGLRR